MKSKNVIFFFIISCFILNTRAQKLELSHGDYKPLNGVGLVIEPLGNIGDKVYLIQHGINLVANTVYLGGGKSKLPLDAYTLCTFNKSTLKLEKEIVFRSGKFKGENCLDNSYNFITAIYTKNKVLLFFSRFDNKLDTEKLYCQNITPEGEFEGGLIDLISVSTKNSLGSGLFLIKQSEDCSKIIILQNNKYQGSTNEQFIGNVYDNNLNKIYSNSIDLPYKDVKTTLVNFEISNTGDLYLLLNVEIEKELRKNPKEKDIFTLICKSKDAPYKEFKPEIANAKVNETDIFINNKNNTVIFNGTYTGLEDTKEIKTKGYFFINYSFTSSKTLLIGQKEFDKNTQESLTNMNELEGVKKQYDDNLTTPYPIPSIFKFSNIFYKKDGSFSIVAENAWYVIPIALNSSEVVSTKKLKPGSFTEYEPTTYEIRDPMLSHSAQFNNSIFIFNISSEGNIKDIKTIPKLQLGRNHLNDLTMSFFTAEKNEKLYFIFDDDIDNLNCDNNYPKNLVSLKKLACIYAELDANNKTKRTLLINSNETEVSAIPRNGIKIEDGVYIMPCILNKSQIGLSKVEIK